MTIPTTSETLAELVREIDRRSGQDSGWLDHGSDLAALVETARDRLDLDERLRFDAANPLKIVKYLRTGNLEELDEVTNTRDLLDVMGDVLDHHCAHDIFGDVIFEAEDGATYIAEVQGRIGDVDPEYLQVLPSHPAEVADDPIT